MKAHDTTTPVTQADPVRGLDAAANGMRIDLANTRVEPGAPVRLAFSIAGRGGNAVTEFEVEHERRMHMIVVRRDLTGFQHLHPEMDESGTWSVTAVVPDPGVYRVFADFVHEGEARTLAADLTVAGRSPERPLPEPAISARTDSGYRVALASGPTAAGQAAEIGFTVAKDGRPVELQPYLGARGHLVALREGDLAFLHVHPTDAGSDRPITFITEFPSAGRYRLFLQFRHEGEVHTAAFTTAVGN